MDNFTNQSGFDRQQYMRKNRRIKAKRRRLRFLFFSCICIAALILAIGLDGTLPARPLSAASEEKGNGLDPVNPPTEDSQNNVDKTQWYLILVNKWNPIPDDYSVELTQLVNGQSIDSRIYVSLQEMFDAARADGIYPVVAAGYRTAEKQQSLMDEKVAVFKAEGYSSDDAKCEAERWVAVPGTSEHQLGIAVDINADGIHSTGNEVYEWLAKNAHYYGFILRYPENKEDVTGTAYEPWHYRYVGAEAAIEIYEDDLCLEEYLEASH